MVAQQKIEPTINSNFIKYLCHSYALKIRLSLFTLCFSTKSKNKSVENGCVVKMRVFLNADVIVVQMPDNQYNELKHNIATANSSTRTANI